MKAIKAAFGVLAGLVLGTVVCWGGLYLYGAFVLSGQGSLFDTHPEMANRFFLGWAMVCALFAGLGGAWCAKRDQRRGAAR
jgi:hypothetical protein